MSDFDRLKTYIREKQIFVIKAIGDFRPDNALVQDVTIEVYHFLLPLYATGA